MRYRSIFIFCLSLILIGAFLWLRIGTQPAITELRGYLDHVSYDSQFRLFQNFNKKTDFNVVVIDIDEKSLSEIGPWPWPRDELAKLLEHLQKQGILVTAFDMVFAQPEPNPVDQILKKIGNSQEKKLETLKNNIQWSRDLIDNDHILSKQLQNSDTVIGFILHGLDQLPVGQLPKPEFQLNSKYYSILSLKNYTANIPLFVTSAKTCGFLTTLPDSDGIIRKTPLILRHEQSVYASLSLQAVKLFLLAEHINIQSSSIGGIEMLDHVQLGNKHIPTDEHGLMLIPYLGTAHTFPYFSATDIIHDRVAPKALENKIAFIGTSALGLSDLRASPLHRAHPGVEIHANIAQAILDNRYLVRPSWALGAEALLMCCLGLFYILLYFLCSPIYILASTLFMPLIIISGCYYYWSEQGYVFYVMLPLIQSVALSLLFSMTGLSQEYRTRIKIKNLFSQYVPEQHIEEILEQPEELGLSGETRYMTVMFSDIRNFTTISENLSATEIKDLLNRFLTAMTKIIFDHGGTIDKYVGDMIVAFWGAPLNDPQHAQHAVDAALAMQLKTLELQELFSKEQLPLIQIGIGINTGPMNVGDMGSQYRRAYTVLGDSVNQASRFEGLTKYYHVPILVGSSTVQACPDMSFRWIDSVTVKGKSTSTPLYQPFKKTSDLSEHDRNTLTLHEEWMELQSTDASRAAQHLTALWTHTHDPLYAFYLERLAQGSSR